MQFEEVSTIYANITNLTTTETPLADTRLHYGRYEFIKINPGVAIFSLVVLFLESVIGTIGNTITLVVFATGSKLKVVEQIFMINLVLSDFYVVTVADPMAIVAKLEGKEFFDKFPGLCQTIGSLCTVSCFASLLTIGLMSINRFVYICANDKYEIIFTKRNCIFMCISEYIVGTCFVLLNLADIGDHSFDHKTLECIWDRMTTYPYTVVFFVVLVWMPSIIIGICYMKIFLFIRAHRKRMTEQNVPQTKNRSFQLAKTLFLIYAVFTTCWAPYAILAVVDAQNEAPHEVYVFVVIFAHMHPSVNWIIYYKTNKHFAHGVRNLFKKCSRRATSDDKKETGLSTTVQSINGI